MRLESCQSLQEEEEEEEEEEEAPRSRSKSRSRREAEVTQEEGDDFDDDDEHMTEEGEFKCSTVVADGLPKGAGIPTEVIAHLMTCTAALITSASSVCCIDQPGHRMSHGCFMPCHHHVQLLNSMPRSPNVIFV